jgi:periplasmic divalent cation tolerance protein
MASKYIQILTAVAKKQTAQRIAKALVDKKLAACCQIVGPVESIYRWQGKIKKAKEFFVLAKTLNNKYKEAEKAVKKLHPYKVPEIIALPIIKGSREYLEWINELLRPWRDGVSFRPSPTVVGFGRQRSGKFFRRLHPRRQSVRGIPPSNKTITIN